MHMCMQKLLWGMNKSKQMQFELESILMDSFQLTAKNLQNAFFTLCSWGLKIGLVYDSHIHFLWQCYIGYHISQLEDCVFSLICLLLCRSESKENFFTVRYCMNLNFKFLWNKSLVLDAVCIVILQSRPFRLQPLFVCLDLKILFNFPENWVSKFSLLIRIFIFIVILFSN